MPMTSAFVSGSRRTLCSRNYIARMMSTKFSYEDAMHKLNNLQSNKASLEQIRKDMKTGKQCTNLADMENYLARCGITLDKLDTMSVIHIAGTKGKGSTSAMCESILRYHGYKTGFFSSPHLVSVCERIRLNGRIIQKDKFTDSFHKVYNMLETSKAYEGDMPKYFAFLTVLAYHIFLCEKVDVAIIEVGIGGIVDYTNILRKVPVVGITALGLDHTSILGNTIEEIAYAKGGIMKPTCQAFTVRQHENAMKVLRNIADKVQCQLHIVPDYKSYLFPNNNKTKILPVELEAYCMNASLAIQLAHAWMNTNGKKVKKMEKKYFLNEEIISQYEYNKVFIDNVPMNTLLGLVHCKWPGRYQIVKSDYAQFYLDGAHTKESMEICSQWFINHSGENDKSLIFSATGDRDAETLLTPLKDINFETVYFVTPTAFKEINDKNDNYSIMERRELVSRCQRNAEVWEKLTSSSSKIEILECVGDALKIIKLKKSLPFVLVTGSLHLVGATLSILDRNLCDC